MFTERIKFLDRKIQPGLVKLTWAARGVAEAFVQDCRQQAAKVDDAASFLVPNTAEADQTVEFCRCRAV